MSGKSPALAAEVKRLAYLSSSTERPNHKYMLEFMYCPEDPDVWGIFIEKFFTSRARMVEYRTMHIRAIEEHLQMKVHEILVYRRTCENPLNWLLFDRHYPNFYDRRRQNYGNKIRS